MRKPSRARLCLEQLESRLALSSFYVAPTGKDSNAGTRAAPWLTLQHAVDTIQPGDMILVESGTYAGCRIGNSGRAGALCTLQADIGATVVVNASGPNNKHSSNIEVENFSATVQYWTIQGIEVKNSLHYGIDIRVTSHITVQYCSVHNSAATGIFLAFSDYPAILNNRSYANGEHGIYDSNSGDFPTIRKNIVYLNHDAGIHMNGDILQGGDGIITGAIVERNIIHDNGTGGAAGINCDGVQNSIFRNNLLYNNHASGIALFQQDGGGPSSGNVVVNNTIVMASDGRWALQITNGAIDTTVYNNILYNNSGHGSINISPDSLLGFVSDFNMVMQRFSADGGNTMQTLSQWQSATGQDLHSIVATPSQLFVNPSPTVNDYHLLANSPAIDAGTATDAPINDLDGRSRPYGNGFDVGCYEYHGQIL
jgi:parallel beta-helix repeat protein